MKLPIDPSKVPYHIWYNNGLYTDWLLIPDVLETLANTRIILGYEIAIFRIVE